ncbi:hypothetical protein LG3211_2974 [Lysobacter gummosus]|nr:hypothetical protein LG3211_2974 [Lysobacter gummosus]
MAWVPVAPLREQLRKAALRQACETIRLNDWQALDARRDLLCLRAC